MQKEKPFYLRWRAENKQGAHIYLREPHYAAIVELQEQLRIALSLTVCRDNPSFTIANAIELLIEEGLGDKNELLNTYINTNGKMYDLVHGHITDPNIIDFKKYR